MYGRSSVNIITAWKSPEIMVALLKGPLHIDGLLKVVGGSSTTIEDRVNHLVKARFIKEKREGRRRILELTPRGVRTAKRLKKLLE